MLMEYGSRGPEVMEKKFAEDIYDSLPTVETGIEIPKAATSRLGAGKDTTLNISVQERLGREGWDFDILKLVRVGDFMFNRSGEVFEILEIKKGKIRVRNRETKAETEIIAQPMNVRTKEYSYGLRNSKLTKRIKVYDAVFRNNSLDTQGFIDDIVSSIPAACMEVFDEIQIHQKDSSKAGHFRTESSIFSDRRVLALYIDRDESSPQNAIETTFHELGHAIAKYLKGTTNPGEVWKRAMLADGNSVSEYAAKTRYPKLKDAGEVEDFADSVMMYLATDGAKTTQTQPLRTFCDNRFELLDQVFQDLSARQRENTVSRLAGRISRQPGALDKKS